MPNNAAKGTKNHFDYYINPTSNVENLQDLVNHPSPPCKILQIERLRKQHRFINACSTLATEMNSGQGSLQAEKCIIIFATSIDNIYSIQQMLNDMIKLSECKR